MFPHITHIDQVREAIDGKDEFIEANRDSFIVFNYVVNMPDSFPPLTDERASILRECRGLIFDAETEKVISRPFHKFFNVGERLETDVSEIDLTQEHILLDKLDGSFIRPFKTSDGVFRVGTKMGETDIAGYAEHFFDRTEYRQLAEWCFENNLTPIFEFMSRRQKIVIDYGKEDQLVLLAIRHNETGQYIRY